MTNTTDTTPAQYGVSARLRVALALAASELSDDAAALVPTDNDPSSHHGETVEHVARLADVAQYVLGLAVAYQRRCGASWQTIGEAIGISKQAAYARYADSVLTYEWATATAWMTDDAIRDDVPDGAAATAWHAEHLDRWLSDRRTPPRERIPDAAPSVSGGLKPLDRIEEAGLLILASRIISQPDPTRSPAKLHAMRVGQCRRMIEHMESQRTDGSLPEEEADALIARRRAQLAQLEANPPA